MNITTLHVSILIPVYRETPAILKRTMNAILRQKEGQFTIHLLLSGSHNTKAYDYLSTCAENDNRIRFYHHKDRLDTAQARNTLIDQLSETDRKCIAFLDADDEWLPNHIQQFTDVVNLDTTDFVVYTSPYIQRQNARVVFPQGTNANIWSMTRQPLLMSSAVVLNLPKTIRFDSGVAEDFVFFAEIAKQAQLTMGGSAPSVIYDQSNTFRKSTKFKLQRTYTSFNRILGNSFKSLYFLTIYCAFYVKRTLC